MSKSPRRPGGTDLLAQHRRAGKLVLGMVHLPPLPGSIGAADRPAHEVLAAALESALHDARALLDGGANGFIVENFGDAPFYPERVPPETVASMSFLAARLAEAVEQVRPTPGAPPPFIGVNVLRNDAEAALAVAAACGLDAIRINVHCGAMVADQGLLQGRAHETLRRRAVLKSPVALLADVLVKHATPLGASPPDAGAIARDTFHRGRADALIVTGSATGAAADPGTVREVCRAVPGCPVLVGSGVSIASVEDCLREASGVIVGTGLKEDTRVQSPVDVDRVRELVERARRAGARSP